MESQFKTSVRFEGESSGAEKASKNVIRSLDDLEAKAILSEKALAGVNDVVGRSAGRFAALAAGVTVMAAIAEVTKSVVEHTLEYERAQAQLNSALAANGKAAGVNRRELNDLAEAISKTTVFSSDAVTASEAMLLRFRNIGGDVFPRATRAAVDLAAATGKDLTQATQLVGKALQSPLESLKALHKEGIDFTLQQREQIQRMLESGKVAEAQGVILSELESRFRGAGEAARNTFGGALSGLKNQIGDLLTAKGGFPEATDRINQLTTTLQDPKTKDAVDRFVGGISLAITKLVELVTKGINAIKGAAEAAAYVTSGDAGRDLGNRVQGAGNLLRAYAGGPFSALSYAYAGGGGGGESASALEENSAGLNKVTDSAGKAKSALHDFNDEEQKLYEKLLPLVKLHEDYVDTLNALKDQLAAGKITQAEYNAEVAEENRQYAEARKNADLAAKNFAERFENLKQLSAAIETNAARWEELRRKSDPTIAGYDEFNDKLKQAIDTMEAMGPPTQRQVVEFQALRDSLLDQAAGVDKATLAWRKFEGVRAFLESVGEQAGLTDDQIRQMVDSARQSTQDLISGAEDVGSAIDDNIISKFDEIKNVVVDLSSEWGKNAAQLIDGLERIAKSESDIADAKKKLAALNPAEKDYQSKSVAFEKLIKQLEENRLSSQLGGFAALAEGASGFFDKTSRGYKVLQATSMAFHAIEMAQQLEEQGPAAVTALLKSLDAPFPANLASFAAVAAIIASLGVAVHGGGGGSSSFDTLASDRQKTQGTGTVLGDKSAQSESIAHSLDLLTNLADQNLDYSRGMLDQLRSINAGINGFGALLFRQAGGITPFAGFSQDRQFTTGSFGANFGRFAGGGYDPLGLFDKGGALGGAALKIPGVGHGLGLLQGLGQKIWDGIFGSTSFNLADQGITFDPNQMLGSILGGGQANAQFYGDIHEHHGSLFGLSNSDSITRQTQALTPEVQNQITQIISGLGNTVLDAVDLLGLDVDAARTKINGLKLGGPGGLLSSVDISLNGLSGDDLNKAVSAVFSQLGDNIAAQIVPAVSEFQQVGEGLLETLVRVSSETRAVSGALHDLGAGFGQVAGLDLARDAEALITAAGGLDKLSSDITSFYDKFVSDADKTTNATAQLNQVLGEFNLGTLPATRDGFRALVAGLDLTSDAGRNAFVALTSMADVADQVYASMEAADKQALDDFNAQLSAKQDEFNQIATDYQNAIKGISDTLKQQSQAIANVRNSLASSILTIQRQTPGWNEAAYQTGQINSLRGKLGQGSIDDQIGTVQSLQAAIVARYNAEFQHLQDVQQHQQQIAQQQDQAYQQQMQQYQAQMQALQQLKAFTDSLKLGELSPLLAGDKLQAAKGAYGQALLAAQRGGSPESLQNLQQAAQTYLSQARDYYASGDDYTKIFGDVTGSLDRISGKRVVAPAAPAPIGGVLGAADMAAQQSKLQQDAISQLQDLDKTLTTLQGQAQKNFDDNFASLTREFNASTDRIVAEMKAQTAAAALASRVNHEDIVKSGQAIVQSVQASAQKIASSVASLVQAQQQIAATQKAAANTAKAA